ncbi:TadE family type IV pilus minor pilin [Actinophytocola sp.]|uniref:TadE family type IV pilus minor pilin n=1 Tax=Actinophytocola sp. TaxID=1872138 RepID=UPI00389B0187
MARHRRGKRENDRGAVTVETAIGLTALFLVLGLLLYGVSAAADQVRCVDAAREAARLTARGDVDLAREAAARIAPAGAEVDVQIEGERVHVDVDATPAGDLLPGVHLHAEAFAVREPGG